MLPNKFLSNGEHGFSLFSTVFALGIGSASIMFCLNAFGAFHSQYQSASNFTHAVQANKVSKIRLFKLFERKLSNSDFIFTGCELAKGTQWLEACKEVNFSIYNSSGTTVPITVRNRCVTPKAKFNQATKGTRSVCDQVCKGNQVPTIDVVVGGTNSTINLGDMRLSKLAGQSICFVRNNYPEPVSTIGNKNSVHFIVSTKYKHRKDLIGTHTTEDFYVAPRF